jgi:tetratricopeptide (TPR) repeat protein
LSSFDPASEPERPDRVIGGYRLVREIGRGSMGVVYAALDEQDPKKSLVALKVLVGSASMEKAVRRFHREAETLQKIRHPNIVPIHRIGEERGTHYYAMRLVEGETVAARLRRGPIEPRRAAKIAAEAARALEHAHGLTIVHRDVKPANLILDDGGSTLLTDFGLATHERAATITESGTLVGTPMYMSPEQVSGVRDEVDARTDVYSLGATLWEMLAGSPPFDSASVQSILRQIMDDDPTPPSRRNRNVPRALDAITLKAMEKSPNRRYQTAGALADDLERFLAGERVSARLPGVLARSARSMRRRPKLAAAVVTLAALLAASVVWTAAEIGRRNRDRRHAQLLEDAAGADRSGDFPRAIRALDEAVHADPRDAVALLRRGIVQAHADHPDDARKDFRAAAELAPHSADPWLELGDLERRLERSDEAFEAYEEGRRREPGSPAPALAAADLALARGDQRRAAAELESAKEVAPNDARVIQAYASFEMLRGRREEAERYLNLLQILNPLAATPPGLGEKVVDTAQKRIADFRVIPDTIAKAPETLRKTPEAASSFFARMQASFARADARKQVDEITKQIEETNDVSAVAALRLRRALALRDAGEFDAASTDFVLASRDSPNDPEPWRLLARMHLDETAWSNRNVKEAVRFAEQASKLDPLGAVCKETLADAYFATSRVDDARRVFDDLISISPSGPDHDRLVAKRASCDAAPK